MWLTDLLDSRFRRRPFTQLTLGLCFLFIAKSITKLWLLLLPEVDRLESLQVIEEEGRHIAPRVEGRITMVANS